MREGNVASVSVFDIEEARAFEFPGYKQGKAICRNQFTPRLTVLRRERRSLMGNVEGKIRSLGLEFPVRNDEKPSVIESVKKAGDLIFVSGHGPQRLDGSMAYTGKLGKDIDIEQGYEAAELCALSCLGSLRNVVDSLDQVEILSVRGFVNSATDFYDQPKVMNGASELLIKVFGERGRHVRTAIGMSALPGNIPVEVQMVVRILS